MELNGIYRDYLKRCKKYHKDARVITARRIYREDLKNGMPEREAWCKAHLIYAAVSAEYHKPRA